MISEFDRLGVGVGIAVVHLAADLDAPVARPDGEPSVEHDRHGDDRDIDPSIGNCEDHCRQREFEDGRQRVQDGEADDRLDALYAALDDARQAAGATLEVEAQRQVMHVHERFVRELAHRILPDAGKKRVAQLVKPSLKQAHQIVGDDKCRRHQQEIRQRRWRRMVAGQCVGRPFEEIGYGNQHQLGNDEIDGRPDDTRAQIAALRRPHIGLQVEQGPQSRAGGRRNRFVSQCFLPCVPPFPRSAAGGDFGTYGCWVVPAQAPVASPVVQQEAARSVRRPAVSASAS